MPPVVYQRLPADLEAVAVRRERLAAATEAAVPLPRPGRAVLRGAWAAQARELQAGPGGLRDLPPDGARLKRQPVLVVPVILAALAGVVMGRPEETGTGEVPAPG